jgi:DNA-binding transcriptional ArsR family regulator
MADLLPSSPDPSAGDGSEPRVIGVDSDDADDLLAALQSETARDVLGVLYDEPATPSDLADDVDTSIQNVRYHLDKLTDADLVEVADTIYSEKGREMNVYAPVAKPLVVFAGNDDETPGIEAALSRLLGGLGVLGLSSVAVQRIFGGPNGVGGSPDITFQGGDDASESGGSEDVATEDQSATYDDAEAESATTTDGSGNATDGGGGGATTTEEAAETTQEAGDTTRETAETTQEAADTTTTASDATTVEEGAETTTDVVEETSRMLAETTTEEAAQSTTTVAEAAGSAVGGVPPGLVFFAGGLVVLLALGLAWYLRGR